MLRFHAAILVALALLVLGAISCGANETPRPPDKANRLGEAVTIEGVMQHVRRFAEIAEENGGNRAAGTPGYDASAEYVADTLRAAGYEVTVEPFEFSYFEELEPARLELVSPEARSYALNEEIRVLQYSGSGDVTARIRPVNFGGFGTSASGCEASDFEDFREGDAALLRRGVCPFGQKAENAEAAGASAAVISGKKDEPFSGTLGGPGTSIPVIATNSAVGEELARLAGDATVRVVASTRSETRETSNVVAETKTGRADRTVMVGAHLDSVPEGPGINDNGSGTSTILEIAEEIDELGIEPESKLRFAFWGAEELGLLGSTRYAKGLSEQEVEEIEAYLNFDMLGSTNGVRVVYDDAGNPSGSDRVEEAFLDYFTSRGLEAEPDDTLVGRSDHAPVGERGVPVGGLFSGAEGRKTRSEADDYGGEAGEAHDPCYHQACDDLDNLEPRLLDQMSDAAADATLRFAEGRE